MQVDEFARKFNSPLTDLNYPVIVQVLPFSSLGSGVPLSQFMSRSGEGMSTPTSAILASGVSPPPVSAPKPSASIAPLSPSARVVQPSTPSNVVDPSSGMVTRIPSAHFASPSFMQSA